MKQPALKRQKRSGNLRYQAGARRSLCGRHQDNQAPERRLPEQSRLYASWMILECSWMFLDKNNVLRVGGQRAIVCEFVMNVPSASHMGRVWERQIRMIQSILTVMLERSAIRLDTTTLRTFLYETMAIINSRPLSVEHLHDPTGPEPIIPNHMLTMKSSVILPPPGQFGKEDLYLCKRRRRVQFLANEFWQRWKREYLLNMQQRQKWQGTSWNSQVDDIVILQDDNSLRNEWKLARVVEPHPSADGIVRKLKLLVGDTAFDKGKPTRSPPPQFTSKGLFTS